ncbi:mbre TPR repeat [Brachionus plicatilis]|uniref:Mbre TPR repeat n=1 Tax=Brachionus plicatilis TaxID=10195 RepID=A0A3M7PAP4_BRAPC|nr:mbre TPR repeat [Brachionus plicatilis]
MRAFNNEHPSIGDTYNNLGNVYDSMGEYNKAIEYYEKSLEIKMRAFNNEHPSIGVIYINLGVVYYSIGEYNKAIEYFNKSLGIFLKSFNYDHPSIAEIYNNLGNVFKSKGEYNKAIEYYEKSLEIKRYDCFNNIHLSKFWSKFDELDGKYSYAKFKNSNFKIYQFYYYKGGDSIILESKISSQYKRNFDHDHFDISFVLNLLQHFILLKLEKIIRSSFLVLFFNYEFQIF